MDATQRLVVMVMMATRSDGVWAAQTTGREMSRQNGKGDEVEVVELWGLVQRAERILHTVHDAVLLATESQSRLLDGCIEAHADLRRLKARAWRGTGQQMIEMRNGGTIWYRTRTGGGARGVDEVDRVVIDEAQHAEEEHLSAVTPTTLASANPQINALGSAGIANKSSWWWRQRKRALGPDPGAFGYVGHTAERLELDARGLVIQGKVDVHDRSLWRQANPALVAGRVGEEFFEEQLLRLGPDLFAREHLGVWDPDPVGLGEVVIPLDKWAACADSGSKIEGPPAFAIDVSPDHRHASIGAAWLRPDGRVHVERVDGADGTGWVVDRCKTLKAHKPLGFVVDPTSPAASLIPDLTAAGVKTTPTKSADFHAACGNLHDAAIEGRLAHLDQPSLNGALVAAQRRMVGDGAWVWDRRKAESDITALVAVTGAYWLATNRPKRGRLFVGTT